MNYRDFFKKEAITAKLKDAPKLSNVDPKELEMGIKVEKEHATDEATARIIAMHHLAEDPKYYTHMKSAGLKEDFADLNGLPKRDGALDIPHHGQPIKMAKIIQVGPVGASQPASGEVSGYTNVVQPDDKEPITAAGKSDSVVATKSVGGPVAPGEGQKQGGPNTKGKIANTPSNPTIESPSPSKGITPKNVKIAGDVVDVHGTASPDVLAKMGACAGSPPAQDVTVDLMEGKKARRILRSIIAECMDELAAEAGAISEALPVKLDLNKIVDVEIDGIDHRDYPEFSDAYVSAAWYPAVPNPRDGHPEDWRELTDDELDWLNNNARDWVYEKTWNYIHESVNEVAPKIDPDAKEVEEGGVIGWAQFLTEPQKKALEVLERKGWRATNAFPGQPDAEGGMADETVTVVVAKKGPGRWDHRSGEVDPDGSVNGQPVDKFLATQLQEKAPKGWEGTVKAMKKEPGIDNPWALAHWMKGKGMKSHKNEIGLPAPKIKEPKPSGRPISPEEEAIIKKLGFKSARPNDPVFSQLNDIDGAWWLDYRVNVKGSTIGDAAELWIYHNPRERDYPWAIHSELYSNKYDRTFTYERMAEDIKHLVSIIKTDLPLIKKDGMEAYDNHEPLFSVDEKVNEEDDVIKAPPGGFPKPDVELPPPVEEASYKVVSPTQARCSKCDHARKIQTEPDVTENHKTQGPSARVFQDSPQFPDAVRDPKIAEAVMSYTTFRQGNKVWHYDDRGRYKVGEPSKADKQRSSPVRPQDPTDKNKARKWWRTENKNEEVLKEVIRSIVREVLSKE